MLRGELAYNSTMAHMTRVGSAGFDSYYRAASGNMEYQRSFLPGEAQKEFKIIIGYNPGKGMCDWQINFPLYGGVEFLEIGLTPDARLAAPAAHAIAKPIVNHISLRNPYTSFFQKWRRQWAAPFII